MKDKIYYYFASNTPPPKIVRKATAGLASNKLLTRKEASNAMAEWESWERIPFACINGKFTPIRKEHMHLEIHEFAFILRSIVHYQNT